MATRSKNNVQAKAMSPQAATPAAGTVNAKAAVGNAAGNTQQKGLGNAMQPVPNTAENTVEKTKVDDSSILFTVKVLGAKNIRGSKAEHVNSFVRVQFADFDYKDSPVVVDTPVPAFNFNVEQRFHVDQKLIETFANKKITITLLESLPKEKTAVLGSTEINLFQELVKGPLNTATAEQSVSQHVSTAGIKTAQSAQPKDGVDIAKRPVTYREFYPINYTNPKMLGQDRPEFELAFELSQMLVKPADMESGNFINLKFDEMYPVPDEWTLKEGNEKDLNSNIYNYTLHVSLPGVNGNRIISIPGGSLAPCEPLTYPPDVAPQPVLIPGTKPSIKSRMNGRNENFESILAAAGISPSGEKVGPVVHSIVPVPGEPRKVTWAHGTTIWLSPEDVVALRETLMVKRYLEAELVREVQPKFASIQDPNKDKYRGRVLIDCSQLLFPRVIGLKGRFAVNAFDTPAATNDAAPIETVYQKARTTISLAINCDKMLLDKKKLQPVTKSVRDFIPKAHEGLLPMTSTSESNHDGVKSLLTKVYTGKSAQKASDEFKHKIQEVVRGLVSEYIKVLKTEIEESDDEKLISAMAELKLESGSESEESARRKKFLYFLNRNGSYFSLKEKLKTSVVDVVRERFQKKSPFASQAELQVFMSEVYVYLVDQMHVSINEMFKNPEKLIKSPVAEKRSDLVNLKKYADLAEQDQQVEIGTFYHSERVAKYEDNLQVWFDYACFCKRANQPNKADECFKEILSRDSKHIPTLLAYGMHCAMQERFEEARVYLQYAVLLQPRYPLALALSSLYFEVLGEDEEAEKAVEEALNAFQESNAASTTSLYLQAAEFLLHCHAGQFAERALAQEIIQNGPRTVPYLQLAKLELQRGNFGLSSEHVRKAIEIRKDDPNAWGLLGHLNYLQKNYADAQTAYEMVLALPEDATDLGLIYTRLGHIHLLQAFGEEEVTTVLPPPGVQVHYEEANQAKTMYLKACELDPSSWTWLGVGKACLILEDWEEAEDAFAEANVLNHRDSAIWAHLALLCLVLKRHFEANQALAQALRLNIKDPIALKSLGIAFFEAGQAPAAAECLRMCLELDPKDEDVKSLFLKSLTEGSKAYFEKTGDAEIGEEVYGAKGGMTMV